MDRGRRLPPARSLGLAAATREAARFSGQLEGWGTVEAGKRADLVLLEANPLEDIGHTRQIAGVLARGHWHPQAELAAMLAAWAERVKLAELRPPFRRGASA